LGRWLLAGGEAEAAAAASPALLRGEDVMTVLGVRAGPEVGRLLALAREAQALGLVSTREEALALLRRKTARGT
jgi:poly(A) polymerase